MMRKYTQKEIREFIRMGLAISINSYEFEEMREFQNSHLLDRVGYSSGIYGINGGLLKDMESGQLYAAVGRNTALMMAF